MIELRDGMDNTAALRTRAVLSYDPGDGQGEIRLAIHHGEGAQALVTNISPRSHDVHWGEDGIPRPLAGLALDRETADRLARGILGAAPTRTVLPPNVIMWDGLRIAWWLPSGRRRIWFNRRYRPEMQHVSRQEVTHPPLLLVADPGHLQLFALGRNERPTANDPLFQAPYPNVYPSGGVCAGGVAWPRTLDVDRLAEWERSWFDSEGTGFTAQRLTLFPGGHHALWTAMLTAETFPLESLVPLGMSVLDGINHSEGPRTLPFVAEEIVPATPALEAASA